MHKSIFSIGLLIVSLAVISANDKLSLPTNFTWPLNTNQLCFAARFDLTLNVEYKKNDSTNATVAIPLNNTTFQSYSAACPSSESVHQLMITLFDGLSALIFSFTVDEKNSSSLTRIYGYLMVNNQQTFIQNYAPEVEGLHKFSSNVSYFQAARDQSYRCDSKTQLTGIQTNGTLTITSIDVQNLQIQSFLDDSRNFSQYGAEIYCKADTDKNSNVIPIVVGACLAALVVIVLVAYIIGRQRSRNGYQTV